MFGRQEGVSQKDKGWFFWRSILLMIILPVFCFLGAISAEPGGGVPDGDIIRFHVRAHSNDPHDQEIKNYLAGSLLQIFGPRWNECQSSRQLHELLERDRKMIRETASMVLEEKGIHDPVEVEFGKHIFPARFYGDRYYPPGEYASLIVEIGSGEGENWWCVLFPPLCFTVFSVPGGDGALPHRVTREPIPARSRDEKVLPRPVIDEPISNCRDGVLSLPEKTSKWRFWSIEFLKRLFYD